MKSLSKRKISLITQERHSVFRYIYLRTELTKASSRQQIIEEFSRDTTKDKPESLALYYYHPKISEDKIDRHLDFWQTYLEIRQITPDNFNRKFFDDSYNPQETYFVASMPDERSIGSLYEIVGKILSSPLAKSTKMKVLEPYFDFLKNRILINAMTPLLDAHQRRDHRSEIMLSSYLRLPEILPDLNYLRMLIGLVDEHELFFDLITQYYNNLKKKIPTDFQLLVEELNVNYNNALNQT